MKRIFLIMLTICLVMLAGCGNAPAKNIDYLNLTLEDLKNINWDMTLDEFKESIEGVEFEEEEINLEKQLKHIKITEFSFEGLKKNQFGMYFDFEKDVLNSFSISFAIPNDEMDSFLQKCINVFGKPFDVSKNKTTTYWVCDKTGISYNTGNGCLFTVSQYNSELE